MLPRPPHLCIPSPRCRCRRSSRRPNPNASEPRNQLGKSRRSAARVRRPDHSRRAKPRLHRRSDLPHTRRRFPSHSTRNCRLAASAQRTERHSIGPSRALAAPRQQHHQNIRSQDVPSPNRRGLIPLGRDSKLRPHPQGRTSSPSRSPIHLARYHPRRAPRRLPIFSRTCRRARNLPGYSRHQFRPERRCTVGTRGCVVLCLLLQCRRRQWDPHRAPLWRRVQHLRVQDLL